MSFEHTVREWLRLETAPYEAYAAFYRHRRLSRIGTKRPMLLDDLWQSDEISWTTHMHQRGPLQPSTHTMQSIPIAIDVSTGRVNDIAQAAIPDVHPIPCLSTMVVMKSSSHQKSAPRHWTEAEDRKLINAVVQSPLPLKWAQIASMVSNRTGKQCRERYFNHLHVKVKVTEWSPLEDALICRLYKSIGSKWVEISRFIPGRSDNNCKNRWHYLRRHMEKYVSSLPASREIDASTSPIKAQILRVLKKKTKGPRDEMDTAITRALIHMVDTQAPTVAPMPDYSFEFGPFIHPKEFSICVRCSLMIPSAQTGPMCQKTRWCWSCTVTPALLTDDYLRLEHQIRTGPRRVSLGEEERIVHRI